MKKKPWAFPDLGLTRRIWHHPRCPSCSVQLWRFCFLSEKVRISVKFLRIAIPYRQQIGEPNRPSICHEKATSRSHVTAPFAPSWDSTGKDNLIHQLGWVYKILGVGLTSPKSITDSLLSTPYFSFVKSLVAQLLVDSSGFLKKRTLSTPASVKRNVSPPNVKWRCMLISITVLLSCVPVRLGPEDATDFVSTIFGGADWVLTSRLKVTKSQVSGSAANLALTHSSPTLNSLSSYFSVLTMFYVVMFSDCRVLSSLSCCSS